MSQATQGSAYKKRRIAIEETIAQGGYRHFPLQSISFIKLSYFELRAPELLRRRDLVKLRSRLPSSFISLTSFVNVVLPLPFPMPPNFEVIINCINLSRFRGGKFPVGLFPRSIHSLRVEFLEKEPK